MKRQRIDLDEDLAVEVDEAHDKWNVPGSGWLHDALPTAASAQYVRVVSRAARGEIRGYVLHDGVLHLTSPCYTGEWLEMDAAVAASLNARVSPYSVTAGGAVERKA